MATDSPTHAPDNLPVVAHHDAAAITKVDGVQKQAEAYHDAYTSFAAQLHNDPNSAATLKAYRDDMSHELGPDKLGQLELTWAGQHTDRLQGANGSRGASKDREINGDQLAKFSSANPNGAEKSFENSVAADISTRYKNDEFSYFRHSISPGDLSSRADFLGQQAKTPDAARKEGYALMSPVSPELAKQYGVDKKDGQPATLYDLISERDGSGIKKKGGDTQFDKVKDDLLKSGKLTPQQADTVRDLYDNWQTNPLRGDGQFKYITKDAIAKTTGGLPDLEIAGQKTAAQATDVKPVPGAAPGAAPAGDTSAADATAKLKAAMNVDAPKPTDAEALKKTAAIPIPPELQKGDGKPAGPAVAPKGDEKPAGPAVAPKGDEKPAGPAVAPKGDEKPAGPAVAPKGDGKPAGPAVAPKGDEKPAGPAVAPKGDEKPAGPAVAPKGDEKPAGPGQPKLPEHPPLPPERPPEFSPDTSDALNHRTITLGKGPLYDQVAGDLRVHNGGKELPPEAVRQHLADLAKANNWAGSEAQWNAYVKDGSIAHLPRALNQQIRTGMKIIVP